MFSSSSQVVSHFLKKDTSQQVTTQSIEKNQKYKIEIDSLGIVFTYLEAIDLKKQETVASTWGGN